MISVWNFQFDFYLRSPKNGRAAIMFNARVDKCRWRKSTGIVIPVECFSGNTRRVKPGKGVSRDQAMFYNQFLSRMEQKVRRIFEETLERDEHLTMELFQKRFGLPDAQGFRDFAEMHIAKSTYAYTSQQSIRWAVTLLEEGYSHPPTIYELDDAARKLEKVMVKRGLSFNTRQKYHGRIKTLIRAAKAEGYDISNPYEQFKIHAIKGTRQFLELDELDMLLRMFYSHELPEHLQESLKTFLFSCFTGLRYSDVMEISARNLVGSELHFMPVKGRRFSQRVQIPLPDVARNMLPGNIGRLFKRISNDRMNRNIREVIRLSGIEKKITFHCARHTFGTLFVALGGDLLVLKELLGHSKIETTMTYTKLASGLKKKQIRLFDDRFGSITRARRVMVESVA